MTIPSSSNHDGDKTCTSESEHGDVLYYTPYEQWVRRLYMTNLFHPVKLGLQNMESLYQALGRPFDGNNNRKPVTVIHVAGSNGKGSVVHKLSRTLQLLNNGRNKVGMFVSPHISSFRERMQVNGECITEEEVVELLPQIYDICIREDIPATFFEITTALAFAFFAKRRVNVVVLETGLGGRLDATNVLTNQCVAMSIITSIGLEHTRILGDTIELIALEKGGIIKPNRPVLVGPNVPHEVLRECARNKQASDYYISEDVIPAPKNTDAHATAMTTKVVTDYDQENARIAQAALKLLTKLKPELYQGLSEDIVNQGTSVRPPCRFEQVKVAALSDGNYGTPTPTATCQTTMTVILDVAHNPPAMEYLVQKLHSTYLEEDEIDDGSNSSGRTVKKKTSFRVVVGMSSDKNLYLCGKAVLKAVHGDVSRIHLVEAANPRAAKIEDILKAEPSNSSDATKNDDTDEKKRSSPLLSCHYNLEDRSVTYQIKQALDIMMTNKRENNENCTSDDQVQEEILVVCGSVFLMAEAREALGFDEPRDSKYIAEVAGAGSRHGQENFGNSGGTTTLSKSESTKESASPP